MTFTAIDFETANHKKTSACQIGIIVVTDRKKTKDSIIIKSFYYFFC